MKKALSILLTAIITSLCLITNFHAVEPTSFGDMDGGFEITASDALVILQGAVNKIQLSDAQRRYADVNVDKEVTAADALTTLQYAVNKIYEIPTTVHSIYSDDELLIDKGESLLENGAYGTDVTADCSFKVSTEGLE